MNILQIHNHYREWGGEDATVETERASLETEGCKVTSAYAYNLKASQVLSSRKIWYTNINRLLDNNKIDVAHIHNTLQIIGSNVYPLLYKRGIPIVQTLHNYRLICPNGHLLDLHHNICEKCTDGNFVNCFTKKCYRGSSLQSAYMAIQASRCRKEALRYVDQFIAVSEFVKNKYVNSGFPEEKITVKPNYVPLNSYDEIIHKKDYFLYLGRLSFEKGVSTLLRAFSSLPHRLLIAGSGPQENRLKELARDYDNIEFLGYVKGVNKEKLLREALCLIVPSEWYEPFGLIVNEAYNAHTHVIGSSIGSLSDMIKKEHQFEAGNVDQLRDTVTNFMEQYSLNRLTPPHVVDKRIKLLDIYGKVL